MADRQVLLDEEIQKQIRDAFKDLEQPVEIAFWRNGVEVNLDADETQQLLEEVVQLDDRLFLKVYDLQKDVNLAHEMHITKTPAFGLIGLNGVERVDYGLRFLGTPSGHEFSALIHDLIRVSRRNSGLSQETRDFLSSLKEPVLLQVFSTPT